MGRFDSGLFHGYFEYGIELVYIGVQIRGPYKGPTGKSLDDLGPYLFLPRLGGV